MNHISDCTSHAIQDEIDHIMDIVTDKYIKKRLENLRDSIPCSCGFDQVSALVYLMAGEKG